MVDNAERLEEDLRHTKSGLQDTKLDLEKTKNHVKELLFKNASLERELDRRKIQIEVLQQKSDRLERQQFSSTAGHSVEPTNSRRQPYIFDKNGVHHERVSSGPPAPTVEDADEDE